MTGCKAGPSDGAGPVPDQTCTFPILTYAYIAQRALAADLTQALMYGPERVDREASQMGTVQVHQPSRMCALWPGLAAERSQRHRGASVLPVVGLVRVRLTIPPDVLSEAEEDTRCCAGLHWEDHDSMDEYVILRCSTCDCWMALMPYCALTILAYHYQMTRYR